VYEQSTREDILLRKKQELKRSISFRQQAERQREERQRASSDRRQKCLQRLDEQCSELESAVLDPSSDAGSLQHGLNKLMKDCLDAQTFQQVNASSILSRCKVIQQRIQPTELVPVAAVAAAAKKKKPKGKRKGPVKKAPAKNDFATLSVDSEPLTKRKSSKKPSRKSGGSSVARGAGSSSQSLEPSPSSINDKPKTGGKKRKSAIAKSTKVGDDDAWNCLKCKTVNASSRSRCTSCLGWKGGNNSKFVFIFHQPQYQSPYTLIQSPLIISVNAKSGQDSHLHKSNGGGITNAMNEKRGGNGREHSRCY